MGMILPGLDVGRGPAARRLALRRSVTTPNPHPYGGKKDNEHREHRNRLARERYHAQKAQKAAMA